MALGIKKILLVDDDKFLVDMYTMKFKSASFEIISAFSGEDAIEKIKNGFVPDAIIFDIIMPGLSGLEFLEKVKKESLAPNASFIVLSNQGQSSDIEAAKKIGIDGYIVKANTIPSEVLEQVQSIIEKRN